MADNTRDNDSNEQVREDLVRDLRTVLDVVAEGMIRREALLDLRRRAREMANQVRVT